MSNNLFMEIDIPNLIKFYEKCLREIKDIHNFFNMSNERVKIEILEPLPNYKTRTRVVFEEICYTSKVT